MASFNFRQLTSQPWVQRTVGVAAAEYLRLVWRTNSLQLVPSNIYDIVRPTLPMIVSISARIRFTSASPIS